MVNHKQEYWSNKWNTQPAMNYYLINLKQWNGIFFYKILIFFVNKSRKTAISQLNSVDKVGIGQQRNEFWAEKNNEIQTKSRIYFSSTILFHQWKKNQPNRFITECHNLQHFAIWNVSYHDMWFIGDCFFYKFLRSENTICTCFIFIIERLSGNLSNTQIMLHMKNNIFITSLQQIHVFLKNHLRKKTISLFQQNTLRKCIHYNLIRVYSKELIPIKSNTMISKFK